MESQPATHGDRLIRPAFYHVEGGLAFVFKVAECLFVAAVVDLDQHAEEYSSRSAAFNLAYAPRRRVTVSKLPASTRSLAVFVIISCHIRPPGWGHSNHLP
jgi:hypothetical protein